MWWDETIMSWERGNDILSSGNNINIIFHVPPLCCHRTQTNNDRYIYIYQ